MGFLEGVVLLRRVVDGREGFERWGNGAIGSEGVGDQLAEVNELIGFVVGGGDDKVGFAV